ncbi:MAG: transaldolase [Candidatus Magasanikbacteria bacterium]|nr:transaldolase [Candidatus Magasanikbacteria bacterium]
MSRPVNLKTKIFLDSGDPQETREALELLGFLEGQTTNPSLIAKNPELKKKLGVGEALSLQDINEFYKKVVTEISDMIPEGSVSVEVYADAHTSVEEMLAQAHAMNTWIPNAHIKLPITKSGLESAQILSQEGVRLNMTLCFSQEQGASVYSATQGRSKGDVFLSPFIGRLDDRGEDGMNFIQNMVRMFATSDGHIELLAASARTYAHLLECLRLEVDIVTLPIKIIREWVDHGLEMPGAEFVYDAGVLKKLAYETVDLNQSFHTYNIQHDLTDAGLAKFASDWNGLISK